MNGLFITIEGTDGAGKSTQIKLLQEYLKNKNEDVIVTREPGGTEIGEKIRDMLLDNKNTNMDIVTEALLYSASRIQHINEKIKPAISEGKIIICDRFLDSSIVYQGYARGLPLEFVELINKYAFECVPDITIYFDMPPKKGMERKKNATKQLDRIENEDINFHNKVYEGYKNLLKKYPDRIKKIDSSHGIECIHKKVIQYIENILISRRQ